MTDSLPAVPEEGGGRGTPLPSDEMLVTRYLGEPGSPAGRRAVATLFARYDARVYQWCLRLARDHDTALDLAQEAMLTALRDLGQFEGRARFSTWLYTVVRRRALRMLMRERRWLTDEVDADALQSPAPGPEETAANRDEESWVRQAAKELLEPIEAAALMLRCEEGLPVEEVTRLLALPGASGARGVLQSARRKLRAARERRRASEGGQA